MRKRLYSCGFLLFFAISTFAQAPGALMPVIRQQFLSPQGVPLGGAKIHTYFPGGSVPQPTFTDVSLTIQNSNPVIADSGGFASIWLQASLYRICVADLNDVQQYCTDNVSDVGQILYTKAVLLLPPGAALQTVVGPLAANFFQGVTPHTTSPGVRVSILDPTTTVDTPINPFTITAPSPSAANQDYTLGDPGQSGSIPISPGHHGTNSLDCTLGGLTCYRTASIYFTGAACNNTTAFLGFDTFGANSPTPLCISGTNVQKGVMGLPAAYTHVQQNSGTSSAAGTITTTYPAATVGGNGDMGVISVAFNATTTITGCTDGTNAYTQAKHVTNGALSLDVWVFHNMVTKAAGTTLTCTFTAAATGALKWHEYLAPNATSTDVSASNTGSGTSVTTGTTAATAQATELVFAAAGDLAAPTLVNSVNGYVDHGVINSATTVQVDDAGIIAQIIGAQSSAFTLGSSQSFAAAVVTFKAANAGTASAQRQVGLPPFFLASQPVNSFIKWQNPSAVTGLGNIVLGTAVACTPDGSTDDPTYNAETTATVLVSQTAANVLTTTPLANLVSTGCAPNGLLHFRVDRLRYNSADTYEGFVDVDGASLNLGISQ